jgi:hypothetical protein
MQLASVALPCVSARHVFVTVLRLFVELQGTAGDAQPVLPSPAKPEAPAAPTPAPVQQSPAPAPAAAAEAAVTADDSGQAEEAGSAYGDDDFVSVGSASPVKQARHQPGACQVPRCRNTRTA